MNFLFKTLDVGGGAGSQLRDETHKLLARLETSTLADDQQNALATLRDLVRDNMAMTLDEENVRTLIRQLQMATSAGNNNNNDDDQTTQQQGDIDVELLRGCVEILVAVVNNDAAQTRGEGDDDDSGGGGGGGGGYVFGGGRVVGATVLLFTSELANVTILVDLLALNDLYVRFYAAQLLTLLLRTPQAEKVQTAILHHPQGVNAMVEMLADARELVRNEAVLLLIAATTGHATIQKIVAFNGAFELLLGIARDEGGLDGGIVVEDCLRLCVALLDGNASNCAFFAEARCVPLLAPLLDTSGGHGGGGDNDGGGAMITPLGESELLIVARALSVARLLAAATTAANRGVLGPLVQPTAALAAASSVGADLRRSAAAVCGLLVCGCGDNQTLLARAHVAAAVVAADGRVVVTSAPALTHFGRCYT
jgi:hypothetical protein